MQVLRDVRRDVRVHFAARFLLWRRRFERYRLGIAVTPSIGLRGLLGAISVMQSYTGVQCAGIALWVLSDFGLSLRGDLESFSHMPRNTTG